MGFNYKENTSYLVIDYWDRYNYVLEWSIHFFKYPPLPTLKAVILINERGSLTVFINYFVDQQIFWYLASDTWHWRFCFLVFFILNRDEVGITAQVMGKADANKSGRYFLIIRYIRPLVFDLDLH